MKRTDLEKTLGSKINSKIQKNSETGPFAKDAVKPVDKREQRKLDQALGLVPFAVKINIDLVQRIQEIAKEEQASVSEIVTELLHKGLENRK
ncbi:MAG TPA: hypothetical protein PKG60_15295 [Spirochaetota bacterium]|nr:hypothetical protein [Spirochaetota bacterium]HPS87956.1 hypothetical protein [Spirochaetota bacterium]